MFSRSCKTLHQKQASRAFSHHAGEVGSIYRLRSVGALEADLVEGLHAVMSIATLTNMTTRLQL